MRLFFGIEIPDAHKMSVEKAVQKLRMRIPEARWVPRENWHATIKFLGEVPEDKVKEVIDIAATAASGTDPVQTRFTKIGSFPSKKRARVLWLGLEDPANALAHLAARMEKKLGRAGFRQESRKLHPHVTLARLREPGPLNDAVEECGPYRLEEAPFEISELTLFRSYLSPRGSRYEAVRRLPLGE